MASSRLDKDSAPQVGFEPTTLQLTRKALTWTEAFSAISALRPWANGSAEPPLIEWMKDISRMLRRLMLSSLAAIATKQTLWSFRQQSREVFDTGEALIAFHLMSR